MRCLFVVGRFEKCACALGIMWWDIAGFEYPTFASFSFFAGHSLCTVLFISNLDILGRYQESTSILRVIKPL